MRSADHPFESDRLAYLDRLEILGTEPEAAYDDFVTLAAAVCDVPVALISLVAANVQCFKAKVGVDISETPRDLSFCSHAILGSGEFVVEDATLDPRFSDNELVTGDLHLRFYAGIPLLVGGLPVGTICVVDQKPRKLSAGQIDALNRLGRILSALLESRLLENKYQETAKQLRDTESVLDYARRRFEGLFQNLAIASYTTSSDGTIYDFNQAAEELFQRRAFEVVGKNDLELLVAEDERETGIDLRAELLGGHAVRDHERTIRRPDGTLISTLYNACAFSGPDGSPSGTIHTYTDIRERKRLEVELRGSNTELERMAYTDSLTQIANRMSVMNRLKSDIDRSRDGKVCAILLDVDHFKKFNDQFGHPAGDDVLRQVASIIAGNCRPDDLAGRYGGEEFLVVLPRTDLAGATLAAERIRHAVASFPWVSREITVSLGVACSDEVSGSFDRLVSLADVRLYAAKARGRNRVVAGGNTGQKSVAA